MLKEAICVKALKLLVLLLITLLNVQIIEAREKFEFYNGIRSLGMGGASIAVANDETSVFSNPAALGKLRDPFITIFDPELHFGADTSSFVSGFSFDVLSLDGLTEKISEHPGRNFHLKANLFPSIAVPNFTFGVLLKYDINGTVDSENDEIDLNYTQDFAAVLGYNLRFWDGRIKVGFSGRYINRAQITDQNPIPLSDAGNVEFDQLAQNGGALAADAGVILTAPWKWLPTLAVTVRDIGNTSFGLGSGFASGNGEQPDTVEQSIDAAIAFFPIMSNRTRSTFTIEMRDILSDDQEDKDDIMRLFHAGVEFNIYDVLFLRGGWHQRYWSAGIEFVMARLQFQLATYGEEIGTASANQEDRRYALKFAYRF